MTPEPKQPSTAGADLRERLAKLQPQRDDADTYPPWAPARITNRHLRELFDICDAALAAPRIEDGLRERAERILTDVIDSGYIIGALSPPWSTREKAIRSIMGQLTAHTESAAPRIEDGLREAAEKLLCKLDQVEKDTQGIFVMAHIHGQNYTGANWSEEYAMVRAALAATPKENANE